MLRSCRSRSMLPHALHLALLLVLPSGGVVGAFARTPVEGDADVRTLEPDKPRLAERARIGGQPARYRLAGLESSAGYEVRVSFPGTNPVRIRLWLESSAGGGSAAARAQGHGGGLRRARGRKLLDAEKILLSTDAHGRVWLGQDRCAVPSVDVLFEAQPWGRWRDPQHAPADLMYDIVLERSTLGVPHSAAPLLLTAVALVLLAAAAVPWWSDRAVPALLLWLNSEQRSEQAAGRGTAVPRRTLRMAS